MRVILGALEPEGGRLRLRRGARVGTVAQEAPDGPTSLLDTVLAADVERTRLLAEAESAQEPARIGEIHLRLADIEAQSAPARAATILAGLGFDTAAQARPLSSFSGGWRMRVALAAALFAAPDLLLLDEPSNYLDLEGVLWLEGYLRAYPHTLMVASHDRNLLNTVVDTIIHVEALKLTAYTGGFDAFEATRRARIEQRVAARARQETQRRHMQAFVDRFRYKASKARQAQSRLKAIARLAPIAAVDDEAGTEFRFPSPKSLPPPLIALDRVAVGYAPGQPVLRGLDLRLDMGDRVALLGANGNGKSTFAKLLAGRLAPEGGPGCGQVTRAPKLEVGYFAQHQIDELRPDETAIEHMARLLPDTPPVRRRARLAGFGLVQDKAEVAVAKLSGGEKARLLFALVCCREPQLLILDEPTNHLDIDAREALIRAVMDYEGGLILITHDRHLVTTCADRLWLVADGGVRPFEGDVDDYRRMVLDDKAGRAASRPTEPRTSRKDVRRAAAEARAARAEQRRAARRAEAEVARLEAEIAGLDAILAAPQSYDGSTRALADLAKRRGGLAKRLAKAEAAWLAAQENLEEA